jgi:hypothetical protein
LVRDEYYYFRQGKLSFVSVTTSWDYDNEEDAPDPPTIDEYYLNSDCVFQQSSEAITGKFHAVPRKDADAQRLRERANQFTKALAGEDRSDALLDSLEDFPFEPYY